MKTTSNKFKVGSQVICNGFNGSIREICTGKLTGMAVVALDRGQVCVSISELKMTNTNEQTKTGYSREIGMPKTKRDGLANFVQMVINRIEINDSREALLLAVDLLEDINCGLYDDAMTDAKAANTAISELTAKQDRKTQDAYQRGHDAGVHAEQARVTTLLGIGG